MGMWYFIVNDEKKGPFTFDELKLQKINRNTLVWTDSMADWEIAGDVNDFKELFAKTPPPTPKEKQERAQNFDSGNERKAPEESEETSLVDDLGYASWKAIILGVMAIILSYAEFSQKAESWTFLKSLIFNGVYIVAFITVFQALKRYLNQLNNYNKSDNLINGIMALEVFATLVDIFSPKGESNEAVDIILFIAFIIFVVISIILALRLIKIDNDYSGLLNLYGKSMIICLILSFIIQIIGIINANEKLVIFSLILMSVPSFILANLFYSAKTKIKQA